MRILLNLLLFVFLQLLVFVREAQSFWVFPRLLPRLLIRPFSAPSSTSSNRPVLQEEEWTQLLNEKTFEEVYDRYSRSLKDERNRNNGAFSQEQDLLDNNKKQSVFRRFRRRRAARQGSLILLRCGQSEFNANQTFTGWADPDLTLQGIRECERAGQLLVQEGFEVDVVYTSRLKRAIKSAWVVLQTIDAVFVPVYKSWRLNQRMYGPLQGLSKLETAKQVGDTTVQSWRNSLKARPPPLPMEDPSHPCHDRRYNDIEPRSLIPSTESLLDCQARAEPLFQKIREDLVAGKTVLVVAHRDTLRGLIRVIDNISDDAIISEVRIPHGVPVVYKFDDTVYQNLQPIQQSSSQTTNNKKNTKAVVSSKKANYLPHTNAVYLEKPDQVQMQLQQDNLWSNHRFLKSEQDEMKAQRRRDRTLEESLLQLRVESNLVTDISSYSELSSLPVKRTAARWTDDPSEFEDYDEFYDCAFSGDDNNDEIGEGGKDAIATASPSIIPTVLSIPNTTAPSSSSSASTAISSKLQQDPYVVLIRHGRTPHNNLGLFTGWEDPPLAPDGVEDAKRAGRLLLMHGFEFDVVYTSWLTRAIQTAFYVMDELDCVWLPMVKSWRLNERMYGALTGKSKQRIAVEHGEERLKKWRRGYTVRPPPTSSYSTSYPGNDVRRAKHFEDLPVSWKETILRSIEARKLVVHRKFPKTESLKDCMDRSIPFYTERIRKEAVDKGKRVLITSHENAIRGILMHLCDIPESAMNQLHLPNGLPLVYNVKAKCITLLDDGSGADPMKVHDFGPAAQYLFRPCELDDDFYDKMLLQNSKSSS